MDKVDAALFVFAGVSAVWLGYLLLRETARFGWQTALVVVFWLLFTYLVLPRLHAILTRVYVPGYFIGRARTSDGLLGDPVNLAFLGHENQIHRAMTEAGWIRADDLTFFSARRIVSSTLRRISYPQAPVSPLLLFDRQQDFAYQQEVAGSPSKRHHVRFWRCPPGWLLPGGFEVDWLAAGTYDRSVGLSLFTLQITHKIEENTDIERDFIVETVTKGCPSVEVETIRRFSTGYHSRNGGGDVIQTDGDLPIVNLRAIQAPKLPPDDRADSRNKRPMQTTLGAGVALIQAMGYLLIAGVLFFLPELLTAVEATGGDVDVDNMSGQEIRLLGVVLGLTILIVAIIDIGLCLAVLAGHNWARLLLMLSSVLATITAFGSNASGGELITVSHLPTIATSILVLLALSSHRARDYAQRRRHLKLIHANTHPKGAIASRTGST
jgi:hypothetical protein